MIEVETVLLVSCRSREAAFEIHLIKPVDFNALQRIHEVDLTSEPTR